MRFFEVSPRATEELPSRVLRPRDCRSLRNLAVLALLFLQLGCAAQETDEARLRQAARLRSLALAEMEEGEYAGAEGHLRELALILPNNLLPPINLALCYFHLNRREAALREIRRAQKLDPDNAQMLYGLARLLRYDAAAGESWLEVVRHFAAVHPDDARPYYLRSQALEETTEFSQAVELLQQALERAPENLVLMADLLVAAAAAQDLEATVDALNAIEDRLDGFEGNAEDYAEHLRELIDQGKRDSLRPPTQVLRNLLRPTDLYQLSRLPLTGRGQAGRGIFPQLDFDPPLPKSVQGGQDIQIAFEDATELTGLNSAEPTPLTVAARESDVDELLGAGGGALERLELRQGRFHFRSVDLQPPPRGLTISYDINQDELSDLVTAHPGYGIRLYLGRAGGGYRPASVVVEQRGQQGFEGLFPLDVDHDGDLDLFLARAAASDLYLQNNGDGTWTERAQEVGLAGSETDTTDLTVADFDDDGDLDLVVVSPASHPRLYLNQRAGAFREGTSSYDLDSLPGRYDSVETADFDNDGLFDLLLWGDAGGLLLLNRGPGFAAAPLPDSLATAWRTAEVGDYDNDGDQDFAVVLKDGGELLLVRNRRHEFSVEETELSDSGVRALVRGDFDDDGDLDLVAQLAGGGKRLWRNEGGNRNHWVRLRLQGRNDNNAKNNTQGLFSRIEARVGDTFQVLLGDGGVNHLGLGARRQADVIRVVWTNGLAQTWPQVSANQTLVEKQVLKGSCPFLYTWNGERFEFVTDLMWKSPLGMIQADGSPAPHQSARDFVMIPGEALVPVRGELWLQVTAELWESVYVDRQRLMALDHPAAAKLVVDEKLSPPPYAKQAPLHWISQALLPVEARDHLGRDVLAKITRRDSLHVADLPLSRYQGLTHGQALELTFRDVPARKRLRLVLWGWIFPTDTSINFALAQDSTLDPYPPRLEVLQADGQWRTLFSSIGFPNGKRKAMVVELTDRVPSGTVTLRLATNMQVYWDASMLAVGEPESLPRVTTLEPRTADLHYRGYSRLYRETPTGPHLFDYSKVSVGPRFRDMNGAFTRYGPVVELLAEEDDRYVLMNAGDEMTVRFDASALPALPPGWRRDWVLYTDGWVKDADLHTAFSQTVAPLPYHGMKAYPDSPEHRYPAGPEYRSYLSRYQTRMVTDQPFRYALRDREWLLNPPQ